MNNKPWLSVVICTYQGELFVSDMLKSIPAAEMSGVEIIAVDDGSTDATVSILESHTGSLPIRIIKLNHTGNWVANTNRGISESRGKFVTLLHQDDLWLDGRLKVLRELTQRFPEAGFFVHPSLFVDESGRTIGRLTPPLPCADKPLSAETVLTKLIVQNIFSLPAPLFNRELALQAGAMNEKAWFLADWEYWARLVSMTETVYYPRPLTAFRLHPDSQTITRTSDSSDLRQQYYHVISAIESQLDTSSVAVKKALQSAYYNVDVSIALAAFSHGDRSQIFGIIKKGFCMSPAAWHRFLRDSRIIERVLPRLRINLHRKKVRHGGAA